MVENSTMPVLSLLIPLQDHSCADRSVEALARQEVVGHDEFEVIVVDSLYLRDWQAIFEDIRTRYPRLQLTFVTIEPTRSRARCLNVALEHARADLLLMLADDFMPCDRLLSEHLRFHRENLWENLVAIGPGLFPRDDGTSLFMRWLEDSGEIFGVSFTDPAMKLPRHYFYMANTSVKRAFLKRAGQFDERFPYDAMDDWEMGLRLAAVGMEAVYLPDAVAIHEHIITLPDRCQQMENAGETAAIYDRTRSRPGPWGHLLQQRYVPHSKRKKESREARYRRQLDAHWLKGYRREERA